MPTASGATVEFTVNNRVIANADEQIPLKTGTNYLRFEVTAPDGEATKTYLVTVTRLPGLKASFAVPESHDGSTPFTVTLKFNEDISSTLSNVAAAVVVTDGTKGAVTADGSSKRRFLIPVTPDSSGPVRIRVRNANHCDQSHAVCAVSGKLLATEFSRWVGAEDDATLRALWLTRKNGSWIQRRPVFRPDTTSYHAGVANGVEEITLQAAPYAKGVTVAVSGPAGTFTTTERYDGGATAKLDVPAGETTWTVTVTSEDGNETKSYEMTVTRGGDGSTVTADVRLKTLTVTPVDEMGTELSVLSFSPSFHLDTEAATFRVRVPSDTTAVTVSVEKNSASPGVRLMRTETLGLDSLDEDPDLAGIQFELTMDRFDLGGARENRYKSIWVIGPNAGVEGHTAFNRRVYQLWITKAAVGHATAAEPLMAAFENVPLSHDGSSAFTFRMAFTEDVEITPEDMRDHAFVVSGATVTGAERVDGLKSLWELTLEPSGSGPVSILTPLERACTEAGALCTADGRALSVAPALQVAGPVAQGQQAPAPLTASFESVPQAHDGASAFTVRLAFTEEVETTPEDMRDHALTVSGGTVTAAAMVDGRKDLWELTVEPAGSGPVSILTPLERACTEAGALCTADGRALTGGLGVQVPGPPVLTASFASVPQVHDGTSAFTVRLAFSAPIRNSYKHLRDEALSVTGGTVARARRVDGRSDLWELTVEPGGHGAVTVELAAAASCADTGALCTADGRALSNAIATTVAGPPPLTAAFVSVPAEHDGETEFWLELSFNAAVAQDSKKRIRALLGVTGGSETKIRRKDGRLDHWRIRIEPSSHEAVTVTLSPSPACGATGAVCTEDGRTFTTALATQIQGPPGLTVADAEVEEAANATLAFAVTLNRAPSGTVTVDYATSDGTATAGSDYTSTSGTLTFAAGETEKTVSVPVLDDAHDEGSETLTLTLSNVSGAHIADGSATGTINNTDHMPLAWMVRFGRTVGSQVVDALGQRLEGATASHVTVGGIPLTGAPGAVPEAESDDPFGLPDWAARAQSEESAQSLTADDLLLGSAFHLSSGGGQDAGPAYTAWGRVATSGFAAEVDDVTMDGDVTSGLVGFDAEWARILAGVMFSHSTGEGDYGPSAESGARAGRVESSLTGVYPYARVALNARVSAWALAGAASGELTLKEGGAPMPAGITMRMGAVGFKGRVLDGTGASGVGLDVKTDALWVGTKSEDTGELAPTEGDVTRLRVTLAGERAFGVGDGATFTPSAEVGLRHDGGDAETGTGLEVGAGLSYVAGALTVEGQVRTLVAHEDSGYEEWGASGAIRITSGRSGQGLTLSIAPEWGRPASAVERLWSAPDATALGADSAFEGDARLAVDAGYGVGLAHGRGVLTPYAGLVLGDAGRRTMRTGARWQVGADAVLGLEGTRRTSGTGEGDNELMLRLALRF